MFFLDMHFISGIDIIIVLGLGCLVFIDNVGLLVLPWYPMIVGWVARGATDKLELSLIR